LIDIEPIDFRLEQVTLEDIRYYVSPELGKVPSVSTVLKVMPEGVGLEKWKQRLKEEGINPDQRLHYTSIRGTTIHYLITDYLANESNQKSPPLEFSGEEEKQLFEQLNRTTEFSKECSWSYMIFMEKFLRDHDLEAVKNGLEFRVLSTKHKFAGTVDILGYLDGKLTIIDIKTSRKVREKHELQSWAYRQALLETYNVEVEQVAILALPPDKKYLGRFVNPEGNYILEIFTENKLKEFIYFRDKFRMIYGF